MLALFEPKERVERDQRKLANLRQRYQGQLIEVLRERAADDNLGQKDRAHWRRLLRKARRSGLHRN